MTAPWPPFACPDCRLPLASRGERRTCPAGHPGLVSDRGLWRAPITAREHGFLAHYRRVRRDEGWEIEDPEALRALPFHDRRRPELWRIRAASFRLLTASLRDPPLRTVDLGAGNGWLSLRLAAAGHRVAAVDLSDDRGDGLAAAVGLEEGAGSVTWIRASFDRVPLEDAAADLAVFGGSFHYSTAPEQTLAEALRLLAPGGRLAILDSPVYRREASGHRMLAERGRHWAARGLEADPGSGHSAMPEPVGFLTRRALAAWGAPLGLRWSFRPLPLGWRWHLAPWLLPLLGRREPARFPVVLGERIGDRRPGPFR